MHDPFNPQLRALEDTADSFDFSVEGFAPEVSQFLTHYFGEKCEDYEADCECCRRWRLFEELIANPFSQEDRD